MEVAPINSGNAIPTITNQEELDALLQGSTEGSEGEELEEEEAEVTPKADSKKPVQEKAAFNQEGEEEGEDEDESPADDGKQYRHMLDYLNDKHALNLNVEALPENLSREQEAEVVSSVIEKMTNGVNQALAQYKHLDELTQNPEAMYVLQGLSEGKTLKDIAKEYQASSDGMDSETLVFSDFKKRYPTLKEEVIKKMVEGSKQSGEFELIADSIREYRNSEELDAAKQQAQLSQRNKELAEQSRIEDIQNFQQKLATVKNVYGVPLDDQMRADVFTAATQRNQQGLTYLDEALQSDEGILLATLGLLHLEKLISAKASVKANRKNKSFIDKVFDTPERLQSGSARGHEEEFDVDLVNRF